MPRCQACLRLADRTAPSQHHARQICMAVAYPVVRKGHPGVHVKLPWFKSARRPRYQSAEPGSFSPAPACACSGEDLGLYGARLPVMLLHQRGLWCQVPRWWRAAWWRNGGAELVPRPSAGPRARRSKRLNSNARFRMLESACRRFWTQGAAFIAVRAAGPCDRI